MKKYLRGLKQKQAYLRTLISTYNDGKSKGFYCNAVNLLPISAIDEIMGAIKKDISVKEQAKAIAELMHAKAKELGIGLVLRK